MLSGRHALSDPIYNIRERQNQKDRKHVSSGKAPAGREINYKGAYEDSLEGQKYSAS